MAKLIRMGNKLLQLGSTTAMAGVLTVTPPSSRTWKVVTSVKGSFGHEWTNIAVGSNAGYQDIRSGSTVLYDPLNEQMLQNMDRGGRIVSMPADANIDACWLGARLNINLGGMREAPNVFNDRILVFEIVSGTIGDGNTLGFQNLGSGAANVVNSSGASYRLEQTITGIESETGELIPRINFGGTKGTQSRLDQLALFNNPLYMIYFKDQEAEAKDIVNNPHKAFNLTYKSRLDNEDVLRLMDLTGNMINSANHLLGQAQITDQCWLAFTENYATDNNAQGVAHSSRHGIPLEFFFDLCANGSPTSKHWEGWYNLPGWMNGPVRRCTRTFQTSGDTTYREDGVTNTWAKGTTFRWLDQDIVDISTASITGDPANGSASYDPTSGCITYNPVGGTPFTNDSGGKVVVTMSAKRWTYDSNNNRTPGPDRTIKVPIWVLYDSGRLTYWCRPDTGAQFESNFDWFTDPHLWESQAREFIGKLIASDYSTTVPLWTEILNETWNGSGSRFEPGKLFMRGIGTYYHDQWDAWQIANGENDVPHGTSSEQGGSGTGIWTAFAYHYFKEEMADKSVDYDIRWILSTQTALSSFAASFTQGFKFALEDIFGYSASEVSAAMSKFYTSGTSYTYGPLDDSYGSDNLSGLTDAAAHANEILDRFDGTKVGYNANSSTLRDEMIAWMTSDTPKGFNNKAVVDLQATLKTVTEAEGGKYFGEYEGGDHAQRGNGGFNIPTAILDSGRTNSDGKTFSEWYTDEFLYGDSRKVILEDLYDRRISQDPDTGIAQYGAYYRRTTSEPWAQGWPFLAPPADLQSKYDDYGRLSS